MEIKLKMEKEKEESLGKREKERRYDEEVREKTIIY